MAPTSRQETPSRIKKIDDPATPAPFPPPQPNLANITGDPHGRQDCPADPAGDWHRHDEAQAEEAAHREWLIRKVKDPYVP